MVFLDLLHGYRNCSQGDFPIKLMLGYNKEKPNAKYIIEIDKHETIVAKSIIFWKFS